MARCQRSGSLVYKEIGMNLNKIVSVSAIACVTISVVAQVAPSLVCCKYNYGLFNHPGGSACGYGTTTLSVCETTSVGTSDPEDMKMGQGQRFAECSDYNIGPNGYWVNIPCEADPPQEGERVGVLPDGSCCYVVNPTGPAVTISVHPTVKVQNCNSTCGDGGLH